MGSRQATRLDEFCVVCKPRLETGRKVGIRQALERGWKSPLWRTSLGPFWSLKGGKKLGNSGQATGANTGEAKRPRKKWGGDCMVGEASVGLRCRHP